MKRIQIGKANHLLRNGAIINDDTDTVSQNVDKNSKTTKTNLQNTKNQTNHLPIYEERPRFIKQKCIQ